MPPGNKNKVINLGKLEDLGSEESDSFDKKVLYKIKKNPGEIRKTIFHFVTHILAFIIITPWIYLQFTRVPITDTYSTIVSVVIGFYFGKTLFKDV